VKAPSSRHFGDKGIAPEFSPYQPCCELDSAAVTAADQITVLNGTIDSTVGAADLIDNDPDVTDPTIVTADIAADNGIVHAIDRVLLPLDVQTIDDLVNDGAGPDADGSDFDLLAAALSATGLSAVTSDPGQSLTVFAPTDAAFIGLAQSLGYNGSDEAGAIVYIIDVATVLGQGNPLPVIEDILLYHVVNGVLDSGDVVAADGTSITTALGADVGIALPELVDASNDFADPQLILTDLDNYVVNGIVHAIDGVLLPVNLDASTGISVGSDGADKVKGGKGVDLINAKAGNDKINGGKGADQIIAGAGNDKISGGKDADSFIFSDGDGADVIKDFGQDDRIVITSSAFELEDLGRNRWEITYGESDSIIVIGKGQVDIEVQIDLLVA